MKRAFIWHILLLFSSIYYWISLYLLHKTLIISCWWSQESIVVMLPHVSNWLLGMLWWTQVPFSRCNTNICNLRDGPWKWRDEVCCFILPGVSATVRLSQQLSFIPGFSSVSLLPSHHLKISWKIQCHHVSSTFPSEAGWQVDSDELLIL